MPKITIEGKSAGGQSRLPPVFGTRNDRANARTENANWDAVRNAQYADARYTNVNYDLQDKNARLEANFINTEHDARLKNLRSEANYINTDFDMRAKNVRMEAKYFNEEHDARMRLTRQEAQYTNVEFDLRIKNARKEAEYIEANRRQIDRTSEREASRRYRDDYALATRMNQDIDRASRSGRGGGGRGYVPFVGALGFGNTGELLGEGVGALLGGGRGAMMGFAAAKVLEELVSAPQIIGNVERGALGSAQPYIDLKRSALGAGRAGGFNGEGLFSSFFPGYYGTPDWMSAAGVGPGTAMSTLGGFGISPRSGNQAVDISRSLSMLQFMPGLSGMDMGSTMNTLGKYGMVSANAGSIGQAGGELSQILENAVTMGLNRAEILHSIDSAVTAAARGGGIGQSTGGLADFLYRFTSMPGGMTGETGLRAMAGLQGAMDTVGSNAVRTFMVGGAAMRKYGSASSLKGLLDKSDQGFYGRYADTPVGAKALQNYFAAVKAGDPYGASMWLKEITKGNPAAQQELLSQTEFMSGPGYLKPILGGNLTGMTPSEFIGAGLSSGLATGPYSGVSDIALKGYRSQGGGSGGAEARMAGGAAPYALNRFDEGNVEEYRRALLRQGTNPAYVDAVIAASRRHGFDPRVYGAYLRNESQGGNDPNVSPGGAYGMTGIDNPAQISMSSGLAKPTSPEDSIEKGAALFGNAFAAPGASMRSVLRAVRGPQMSEKYWQQFVGGLTQGGYGGSVNSDLYSGTATVEQAGMQAAATSFHEMITVIPAVNTALNGLVKVFQRAAIDFSIAANQATGRTTHVYLGGASQ